MLRVLRRAGARSIIKSINRLVRSLSAYTHRLQLSIEWEVTPNPEWFDHFIELHYYWSAYRIPYGWERGIFNLLAIRQGANVLELCCGDGFNAYHFYSIRAGRILSVDFDSLAIEHARRNFHLEHVEYRVADIRAEMPIGTFDNVLWDGAIEHFTEAEISVLLTSIRSRLAPGGVLSGHTIVRREQKSHHDHEHEFVSAQDLANTLQRHFQNVRVIETVYPTRHNLYFFASNERLLFLNFASPNGSRP